MYMVLLAFDTELHYFCLQLVWLLLLLLFSAENLFLLNNCTCHSDSFPRRQLDLDLCIIVSSINR